LALVSKLMWHSHTAPLYSQESYSQPPLHSQGRVRSLGCRGRLPPVPARAQDGVAVRRAQILRPPLPLRAHAAGEMCILDRVGSHIPIYSYSAQDGVAARSAQILRSPLPFRAHAAVEIYITDIRARCHIPIYSNTSTCARWSRKFCDRHFLSERTLQVKYI